jgi:hypothetical protein
MSIGLDQRAKDRRAFGKSHPALRALAFPAAWMLDQNAALRRRCGQMNRLMQPERPILRQKAKNRNDVVRLRRSWKVCGGWKRLIVCHADKSKLVL